MSKRFNPGVVFAVMGLAVSWSCGDAQQAALEESAAEPDPISITHWTEATELFMEYPPLRVGETARFAVHLTELRTFQPLTEGVVLVELRHGGGQTETFSEDGPSRPGIFGVDVRPTRAGSVSMTVRLSSNQVDDVHELGIAVVAAAGSAPSAEADDPPSAGAEEISFLKEQQWLLDFATQQVTRRAMREGLLVPAKIEPRSGGRVAVTAPISGRLATSVRLPIVGASVAGGEVVAAIVPPTKSPSDRPTLQLELKEAEATLALAVQERERVARLLEVGAIPASRLDRARAAESVGEARLESAQARIEQYEATRRADQSPDEVSTFSAPSPLAGVVTEVFATDGSFVEQGTTLLEVVALDRVYVAGQVPEFRAAAVRSPRGAELVAPGVEQPIRLSKLISAARFVDPASRTLKVIYELDNRRRLFAVGQAVSLRLFTSQVTEAPAIPVSALVDEGGRPVVFVQLGGETFIKRPVELGYREGTLVQILGGVEVGERVVTRGAYLVRLASMSTEAPAHGHAH